MHLLVHLSILSIFIKSHQMCSVFFKNFHLPASEKGLFQNAAY